MGSNEGPGAGLQGRGTGAQPANRFDRLHVDVEPDDDPDIVADEDARDRTVPTEFFRDHSRSVISTNDSPDVPFRPASTRTAAASTAASTATRGRRTNSSACPRASTSRRRFL